MSEMCQSKFVIKRVSSLIKVRSEQDIVEDSTPITLFGGEHFSFQTVLCIEDRAELSVSIKSPLEAYIKTYVVKDVVMDYPVNPDRNDEDYLTKIPGTMPDLLVPLEKQNGYVRMHQKEY